MKTIELMNKVKFINSYSFIYSSRPGTPAYRLEKVNDKVAERLIDLCIAEKVKINYRND